MIDNLTILFTTIAVLLIALRASRLDRRLPWFADGRRPVSPRPVSPRPVSPRPAAPVARSSRRA